MAGPFQNDGKAVVLIADDQATARMVMRQVLLVGGFEIVEAEDGRAALQMLDRLKVDAVVSDVMMPVMDGFSLCEEIRRRPEGKFLPVLMVTGLDDIESIHRAYEVGATDFITKPYNALVLQQRVRHMVRESRLVEELQQSEAKNRALLKAMPDMVFRIESDGTIAEWNESKDLDLLRAAGELTGKKLYEILPVKMAESAMAAIGNSLQTGSTEYLEYQLSVAGVPRHFEARLVASGEKEVVTIVRDITQRKRGENALRESEERYALALAGANDGVWDWDMRANEVHYSPRWKAMLGWKDEEIGKSPDEWFRRIHLEDLKQFKIQLNAHLEGTSPHFQVEHRIAHKDGTYLWVVTRGIAVRDDEGKAYRMAGSLTDVTDRRRAEEQLLHDALYDPLTGLANRSLLMDRLDHSLRRAKRSKEDMFAVLFLDLDRFKNVNDTMGHIAGDKLLTYIARRLETCVRPGDTVARIGGDEFVILLESVADGPTADAIAERIEHVLSPSAAVEGQEVFMSASIGIVVASGEYEKAEDILRDADIAVYRAKALGRGCHVTFSQSMYMRTMALLELEGDLRKAIERHELFLQYQPIVSLETGATVSLEALLRWQHPQHGLISPGEFIPIAEETGLILPIGEWVLRRVCEQIAQWRGSHGSSPIVAVNVSAQQLRQSDFPDRVRRILDEFRLAPDCVELEITESVLIDNIDNANDVLDGLRKIGVHLSLDDFGTGYSSLSYLQRFPVEKLKVDKSFIERIGLDSDSSKIVSAIFQLAKGLGLDVVAEGVETDRVASRLRNMGCTLAQGFYFSKPRSVEDLELRFEDEDSLSAG